MYGDIKCVVPAECKECALLTGDSEAGEPAASPPFQYYSKAEGALLLFRNGCMLRIPSGSQTVTPQNQLPVQSTSDFNACHYCFYGLARVTRRIGPFSCRMCR